MMQAPSQARRGITWRSGRLKSLLGPIRVRLALLVAIAAIPLLMLSATIAWQNYQLAIGTTAETAGRLRESAIARHVAAISGAEQMMQALAEVGDLMQNGQEACHTRLASVLALQSARYSNIAADDALGKLSCSALPVPTNGVGAAAAKAVEELARAAASRRDFALGPIRVSALTGQQIIPAIYPIQRTGTVSGFVYAGLRIDWFARVTGEPTPELRALWISDAAGTIVQAASTGPAGLPATAVLHTLQTAGTILDARSTGGMPYAYASARLRDGYSLIVAYPAAADRAAATDLLIRRLGQLCLLLLLGLAAVAIGTHLALVEPLTQLSREVARWRTNNRFDPACLRDPPTEIGELAATFAEATRAVADHAARHQVAVAQQELLMREIHHRVKNNLQIVASLLNLQASRIRVPEARAEFASARDRVRALATLQPTSVYARRSSHHRHARVLDRALQPAVPGHGRGAWTTDQADHRGKPVTDVQRPGRAAIANRDRDGQQRRQIRVSRRSGRQGQRQTDDRRRSCKPGRRG